MSEAEIILKGENHSSRADLNEEREILIDGVDHLILEGVESHDVEYTLSQQWYRLLLFGIRYLFFRPFEQDKQVLEDIATVQDATIVNTRTSNLAILKSSHPIYQGIALISSIVMILGAGIFAHAGRDVPGAGTLLLGILLPLLILRIHESTRSSGNRNQKIASQITEAAKEGGRVVAIVGSEHVEPISEALPEEITPEKKSPVHSLISIGTAKDLAYPLLVLTGLVIVVYWTYGTVISYGLEIVLNLL